MVDGRSGRSIPLWMDENNFGGHTRFGKLLTGVIGAQVASTSSGQTPPAPHGGSIRLVSFENGLDRPHFRIRQSLPGDFYSPLMLFDDLDADGAVEMAVISHEALWSFDTETGRQEFTARYAPMIRTYMAADRLGEALSRRPAPLAGHDQPAHPGARGGPARRPVPGHDALESRRGREGGSVPVGDPDRPRGAGRRLRPRRRWPVRGPGVDHERARRPVAAPRRLRRLDRRAPGRDRRRTGPLGRRPRRRWPSRGLAPRLRATATRALERSRLHRALARRSASSRCSGRSPPKGASAAPRAGTRPSGASRQARTSSCSGSPTASAPADSRETRSSASGRSPLTRHSGTSDDARDPQAERVTWDGKAVGDAEGFRSRSIATSHPRPRRTWLRRRSWRTWADRGRSSCATRRASSSLCHPQGGPTRVLIDGAFEHFQTHVDPAGSGPTICDMDGDGENEIVATLAGTDGKPFCAILDAGGRIKRRLELEPGTSVLNRGPTGSLGPGRGRWIVLRMFDAEGRSSSPGRRVRRQDRREALDAGPLRELRSQPRGLRRPLAHRRS